MGLRPVFIVMLLLEIMVCPPTWAQTIQWKPYDQGIGQARTQDKNIFLHFVTNWCGYCKKMDRITFRDPKVVAYLNRHFISIKVDGEKDLTLARKFKVRGYPDTRFLDRELNQACQVPGFVDPLAFKFFLEYVESGAWKTMDPMTYFKSKR